MKRLAPIAALLVLLATSGAEAHQGELSFMFQFPAGLEPTLDGEMDDWAFVPEVYYNRSAALVMRATSSRNVGRVHRHSVMTSTRRPSHRVASSPSSMARPGLAKSLSSCGAASTQRVK